MLSLTFVIVSVSKWKEHPPVGIHLITVNGSMKLTDSRGRFISITNIYFSNLQAFSPPGNFENVSLLGHPGGAEEL